MTDTNAASTSKVYCPKQQVLQDLLLQEFWIHLSTGSDWKKAIKEALEDTTPIAIERDNFELQGELSTANQTIADQAKRLKDLENILCEYRRVVEQMRTKAGEIMDTRIERQYGSFY